MQPIAEASGPILSSQFGREIGWTENTIILEAGDGLLLFSDGAVDTLDWDDQALGVAGLQDAALQGGFTAQSTATAIGAAIQRASGSRPADDDVTLLLLKVSDEFEPGR